MIPGTTTKLSQQVVEGAATLYALTDVLYISGNPTNSILTRVEVPAGAREGLLFYLINLSADTYFVDGGEPGGNLSSLFGFLLNAGLPLGFLYSPTDGIWYPIY